MSLVKTIRKWMLTHTSINRPWVYVNYVADPPDWDAPDSYYEYRICLETGRWQRYDCHCLGLSPPAYVEDWYDIEPPKEKTKLYKDKYDKWRVRNVTK
ncbi:hypothetical protein VPHD239_0148 [Vibrio phage D239]